MRKGRLIKQQRPGVFACCLCWGEAPGCWLSWQESSACKVHLALGEAPPSPEVQLLPGTGPRQGAGFQGPGARGSSPGNYRRVTLEDRLGNKGYNLTKYIPGSSELGAKLGAKHALLLPHHLLRLKQSNWSKLSRCSLVHVQCLDSNFYLATIIRNFQPDIIY